MYRERAILHFNVADFAVAVEQVADRTLAGRPLVIAPPAAARAVVYDMSEEAYAAGVRKGMFLHQATRLCREATVLQPRPQLYRRAMLDLLHTVHHYSPLVEHGVEDGHLYVDVTGTHRLFGPPQDVGLRVRREVKKGLGINPIWTLAANKLVAKVSSRLVKPVGEYIVGCGEEEVFLAPLPVTLLPGVHACELARLREFRIATVGQLAALTLPQLMVVFGGRSRYLHAASRGNDDSQVVAGSQVGPVIDREHCFTPDTNDRQEVETSVASLVAQAGAELRLRRQAARRVGVVLHYADGGKVARQATVRLGTASDFTLHQLALTALQRAWVRRTRLRGLRLLCDRLHRISPQLPLFPEGDRQKYHEEKLLGALDAVRGKYGPGLLVTGRQPIGKLEMESVVQ